LLRDAFQAIKSHDDTYESPKSQDFKEEPTTSTSSESAGLERLKASRSTIALLERISGDADLRKKLDKVLALLEGGA